MQPEIKSSMLAATNMEPSKNMVFNRFSLANLSKFQVELKLTSNLTLESIPEDILKQIISDNTFENPAYRSNEENNRSNWKTDPTITTYSYENETLVLPRGYMRDLLNIFRENNLTPKIIDSRASNPCKYPGELKGITLRPYQKRAVEDALKYDQGVILAPTGSGKSFIGLELIRQRSQKAMICVHRAELARQWESLIKDRLGLTPGFIGDGRWEVADITVALIQSLASQETLTKRMSDTFGLILLDEHHHAPAESTFHVLSLLSAKHRYGLSASKNRRDGLEVMVNRAIGHEIAMISKDEVEDIGAVIPASVISIQTNFDPGHVNSWHEYLNSINDPNRNLLIIDLSTQSEGAVLVLVDRVSHAEQISEMLTRRNIEHVLAHGKIAKKDRETLMDKIKSSKLTIGTTSLLGEGLDVSVWGTLIMGSPISSEIKLLQAIGRIVRPADRKDKALVYDLKDSHAFSGASFNKRFEIYKKNKIWVEFKK